MNMIPMYFTVVFHIGVIALFIDFALHFNLLCVLILSIVVVAVVIAVIKAALILIIEINNGG